MRAVSTFTLIGAALWFAAGSANAVGFGRVSNTTQLGQPLNFAAAVHLENDEALPRECVSAEVESGENKLQPGQIRVTLEGGEDAHERSVRVTTNALIDEPVVTVSVTVGCTSKITRRFVAFIDPPLINAAQTEPTETLAPQRVDSQVAPIVTLVQGETPGPSSTSSTSGASAARQPDRTNQSAPRPRPRPRVRVAPSAVANSSEAAASRPSAAPRPAQTRQSRAARPAASGPQLRLEPATALAARSASAPASSPAPAVAQAASEPASAAKLDDAAALLAKERQQIQLLEDGLAKLRNDSAATQQSLASLQLRLKEAEAERYANPLVYALAWLSALLALAVAGLWWRQSRNRGSAQWWSAQGAAPSAARSVPMAAVVSAPQPLGAASTAADAFDMSAVTMAEEESPLANVRPFSPTLPVPGPAKDEPPRELSVEELIDLEQQAEFFVVLGQDEAAIELLMSHVRSDGGISPLPYLKLLEIYRRRGDREAYERIRERFNRRFNAYAPDWDSDLQQGRALVDYPDTITRLQALWASPVRVMETLDASLFRRNKTDETFDLPAYRELLFLYSIARDLAEHGGSLAGSDVDVLLPLSGDSDDPDEPISRLMATTPGEFQHSDLMTMPLDLDVSFAPEQPQPPDDQTLPPSSRLKLDEPGGADSNFIDFDLSSPINPSKLDPSKKR
jgi:pilus assembly protein FimV